MLLRNIYLYLAASNGRLARNDTVNHDPEIGFETLPEDTLNEHSFNDRNNTEKDEEALNKENTNFVEDDITEDPNPHRFHCFSSVQTAVTFSTSSTLTDQPTLFQKVKYFIFPPREDINAFIPNYRHLPIISGLLVPFSILLEIPGLTEHWYIRTENKQAVESRTNPTILNFGLGISLGCAVIANICLIRRFLEKRVKTMTILCATFLTLHDLINIVAVTTFVIYHRFDISFTYGQSFWMTVCSTAASCFTNATLIWDLYRTSEFNKSGSGLTRRQRTLVIIIMILFCYICIGALINSLLLKLTFIDGLYFTLVSIETIGFGDIVPETTASKLFICAYSAIGFLNLGVAIVMCRETVLEAMEVEYRKRVHKVKERWKEVRTRGRVESRWRHAIEWRLKDIGMPLWVPDENWHGHRTGGGGRSVKRVQDQSDSVGFSSPKTGRSHSMLGPTGMRLNLKPLTLAQLEASALEAGVPLNTLLPSDFIPAAQETAAHSVSTASAWIHHPLASHFENTFHPTQARTLTHARLGGMSALLTRFAVAAIHIHAATPDEPIDDSLATQNPNPAGETVISAETTNNMNIDSPQTAEASKSLSHLDSHVTSAHSSDSLAIQMLHDLETITFYAKLIIALSLFFLFWTIGSAIFMTTEGWSYGISMYFCFVAFTTIGYGDYHPDTPAGRSIFVVWAILGVGTMTILISVIQEAYNSRYESAMHIRAFDKAVKRYRQHVQHVKPISQSRSHHFHIWGRTRAQAEPSPPPPDKMRSASCSSAFTLLQAKGNDEHKTDISNSHTQAQECLEALPDHVLRHAKTFHTYIRFFVDDANILGTQRDGSTRAMTNGAMAEISDTLRKILDEVAILGGIGNATKEEILQDPNARHTLFVLSIENALHKMVSAAKDAMHAKQERDQHAAQVMQQQMDHNTSDHEGISSAVHILEVHRSQ